SALYCGGSVIGSFLLLPVLDQLVPILDGPNLRAIRHFLDADTDMMSPILALGVRNRGSALYHVSHVALECARRHARVLGIDRSRHHQVNHESRHILSPSH